MKPILLFLLLLNLAEYLRGDEDHQIKSSSNGVTTVTKEIPEESKQNPTPKIIPQEDPHAPDKIKSDTVKVMIRNINSLLVLDGSEFVVKMAPLLGTATQLWTFRRSAVDPNFIIFTNVANGRVLTSWPYTKSLFCYDWADIPYTRWNLNRDRRLISAAYPKDYLTYGFGDLAISLRCGTASDGTDEWILVESKDNQGSY